MTTTWWRHGYEWFNILCYTVNPDISLSDFIDECDPIMEQLYAMEQGWA